MGWFLCIDRMPRVCESQGIRAMSELQLWLA